MCLSTKMIVALLVSSIVLALASEVETSTVQCETTIVSRSYAGIYSDHCPATGVSSTTTSIVLPTLPVTSSFPPLPACILGPQKNSPACLSSLSSMASSNTNTATISSTASSTSSASHLSSTITLTSVPRTTSAPSSTSSATPTTSQSSAIGNAPFNFGLIISAILALGVGLIGDGIL